MSVGGEVVLWRASQWVGLDLHGLPRVQQRKGGSWSCVVLTSGDKVVVQGVWCLRLLTESVWRDPLVECESRVEGNHGRC